MKDSGRKTSSIIEINIKLLGATLFGALGWLSLSHASPAWWGLYLIGWFCLAGALGMVGEALWLMSKSYGREKTVKTYQKEGDGRKAAKFATEDDMDKGGML